MKRIQQAVWALLVAALAAGCSTARGPTPLTPAKRAMFSTVAISERLIAPDKTCFPEGQPGAADSGSVVETIAHAWGQAGKDIDRQRALRDALDNYILIPSSLRDAFAEELARMPSFTRVEFSLQNPADAEFVLDVYAFGFSNRGFLGKNVTPYIMLTGLLIANPPYELTPSWNPRVYWHVPVDERRNRILWECALTVNGDDKGVDAPPRPLFEYLENPETLREAVRAMTRFAARELAADLTADSGAE